MMASSAWLPRVSSGSLRRQEEADDEREEGDAFEQRPNDNHGRLHAAGGFGLAGHAFQSRGADLAEPDAGADDDQPRAEAGAPAGTPRRSVVSLNLLDVLLVLLFVHLPKNRTGHAHGQNQCEGHQAKFLHGIHGNSFSKSEVFQVKPQDERSDSWGSGSPPRIASLIAGLVIVIHARHARCRHRAPHGANVHRRVPRGRHVRRARGPRRKTGPLRTRRGTPARPPRRAPESSKRARPTPTPASPVRRRLGSSSPPSE